MGIQDRAYIRQPAGPAAGPWNRGWSFQSSGRWTITTWLIVLCVGVYVIDGMLQRTAGALHVVLQVPQVQPSPPGEPPQVAWFAGEAFIPVRQADQVALPPGSRVLQQVLMGPIERWTYFSYTTSVAGLELWRWITFQFLHAHTWHLLSNMIGLFFFGPMLERYWGRAKFIAFYLLCGVAGPVAYLLLASAGIITALAYTPLVGASAGIFGILAAAAVIAPRETVLAFGIIPMKLRTLALLLLGVAVFTVFTQGRNAGGEAAHLGGAWLGFVLIRNPHWLGWVEHLSPAGLQRLRRRPPPDGGTPTMRYTGWR